MSDDSFECRYCGRRGNVTWLAAHSHGRWWNWPLRVVVLLALRTIGGYLPAPREDYPGVCSLPAGHRGECHQL